MMNSQESSKFWQPWLADQSTETVEDLVANDQSLHSKILQTIDKKYSNLKIEKQKDVPFWSLETECLEKEQQMETKSYFSLHENTETGRSVSQDTRCKQSTSCRNYCGAIVIEENDKEKTVNNKILDICSSGRSKPSMSICATSTDYVSCFLTTYEMDPNKDLLNKISTEPDIFGHALNQTRTTRMQQGSSNCIKSTQSTDEYSNYLKSPNKGKLFRCEFCDKTDIMKCNLEAHMECHSIERPLKCNASCKLHKNHDNCKLHAGANKCDGWNNTFVIEDDLIEYMRTRTENNSHQCTICNKTFAGKGLLKRHIRTHTGEKPHQCTICCKKFAQKAHLNGHMRTHTGEKPHMCTICNKTFAEKGKLNIHVRNNTGEKRHKCKVCCKKFAQNGSLNEHLRTHTGEKPYQCTVRYKKFTHRKNLNVHIRTHTGVKPYQCIICYKTLPTKQNLNKHRKTHKK